MPGKFQLTVKQRVTEFFGGHCRVAFCLLTTAPGFVSPQNTDSGSLGPGPKLWA